MTAPERREPARSGWCLCSDHDRCAWSGCHCSCHVIGADVPESQQVSRYDGGSKTAPGDAPTSTGSLAPLPRNRKEA
jgi:hypothetical protein